MGGKRSQSYDHRQATDADPSSSQLDPEVRPAVKGLFYLAGWAFDQGEGTLWLNGRFDKDYGPVPAAQYFLLQCLDCSCRLPS